MVKSYFAQFSHKLLHTLLITAIAGSFFLPVLQSAQAATGGKYGVGRIRSCSSSGTPEGLDFDPTTAGKDAEFVLSNPVCMTVILTTYAAVKAAIATMNGVCGTGSSIPRVLPSPIFDSIDMAKASTKVSSDKDCAAAFTAAVSSWGVTIIALGAIFLTAEHVYDNSEICGANWLKPNIEDYNISTPHYKKTVDDYVAATIEQEIKEGTTPEATALNLETNQTYREWYYGGVEVEDNPQNGSTCKDVAREKVDGQYPRQRYYLKGTEPGNFNCKRYDIGEGQNDPLTGEVISQERLAEFKAAHDCCQKRSSDYLCIKYRALGNSYTRFCKSGALCEIGGITFLARSRDNGRLLCAETYSLCPYNFALSGGTEYCDYYQDGKWNSSKGKWDMITPEQIDSGDCSANSEIRGGAGTNDDCEYNAKANKCRNYCQYLRHCTRTSSNSFHYHSGLSSPYFSSACKNFVGDSQNKTSYNTGFLLGSQRHFSAPIAQCVKETLENLFYNRAGHSVCYNTNEYPSADGVCPSGQYADNGNFEFRKGNQVLGESFFESIQKFMHDIVTLVLILSVTFFGMNVLLAKANLADKKVFLTYLLKIALVMYFALGQAWQDTFFDGVYGASSSFAMMVFNINAEDDETRRDGCQFGEITRTNGTVEASRQNYPEGKEYLAIWDTLDCKLMRYMGFGPEVSAANIASLLFAIWWHPIGLYVGLSIFIFAFFFLAATIRALHIFLASCLSIIIMVFVSPIIIPTLLFEKTKSIFDQWFKELISFCLQPMILFAYIAIFITVMDKVLIGSASFHGTPPFKTMSCNAYCTDADGARLGSADDCQLDQEQIVIDPLNDSVACLLNFNDFGAFPGLELIGITIPIIDNLFSSNVKERVLTLLKGALMMYLLYKFMDEISGIASRLIGGSALPGSSANAVQMLGKTIGFTKEVHQRALRGGQKAAASIKNTYEKGLEQSKKYEDASRGGGGNPDEESGGGGNQDNARDNAQSSSGGGGSSDNAQGSEGNGSSDSAGGSDNNAGDNSGESNK